MGLNGNHANALTFDLETVAIDGAKAFVEPVEAPSNYVDPVKIRDYIAKGTLKAVEKCSLDPDLCRLAALGVLAEGEAEPIVWTVVDEAQEAAVLRLFWNMVSMPGGGHRRTISFYGLSFDWPVLVQRSRYLGVPFALPNLDRYRTPHTDLYQLLSFNQVTPGHKLDFYAKRFGINLPADEIDGSQIAEAVAAGEWEKVTRHCRLDVLKTAAIAHRIGALSSAPLLPAQQAVAS